MDVIYWRKRSSSSNGTVYVHKTKDQWQLRKYCDPSCCGVFLFLLNAQPHKGRQPNFPRHHKQSHSHHRGACRCPPCTLVRSAETAPTMMQTSVVAVFRLDDPPPLEPSTSTPASVAGHENQTQKTSQYWKGIIATRSCCESQARQQSAAGAEGKEAPQSRFASRSPEVAVR